MSTSHCVIIKCLQFFYTQPAITQLKLIKMKFHFRELLHSSRHFDKYMAGYRKRHGLRKPSQPRMKEETKVNTLPSGSSDSGFVDEPCTSGGKQKIYSGTRKNGR